MHDNNQEIHAIEQQYQQRKTMTPRQIAISWKDMSCSQILFSEFCLYNLQKFKENYGEGIISEDFLITMKEMCFEEEIPELRPNPCYVYWYKPSSAAYKLASNLVNDNLIGEEVQSKLKEYIAFHRANQVKMQIATRLMSDYSFQIQPLNKLLKPRMKTKFQKAEEFQNTILLALKRLAFAYAGQLKESFDEQYEDEKNTVFNHEKIQDDEDSDFTKSTEYFVGIDKDKILNPPILETFKKDKIAYLKTLSAWFADALEHHRESILVEKLPMAYQKAYEFLDDIKQTLYTTENDSNHQASTTEIKTRDKENNPATISYPRSIFENAKAYLLFCAWIEKATTKKQIEFIYRQMSERENPPLILVKDTAFRNWYNAQEIHTIKLEFHTNTYHLTKNEDRLLAYELLKENLNKLF